MTKTQETSAQRSRSIMLFIALWVCMSIPGCSLFDRTTTVYGRVTEVAGDGVDSIVIVVTAAEGLGAFVGLGTVATDTDGRYELTVEAPKGSRFLDLSIPQSGNPHFTDVFRGYEVYKESKRIGTCCPAKIGHKTNYDFRVYR